MVNYKQQSFQEFVNLGFKQPLKSGETIKVLYQVIIPTTTGLSMEDINGNYQVPTGKQYVIKSIGINGNAAASRTITLFQSDIADGSTNPVNKFIFAPSTVADTQWLATPDNPFFLADKYVNQKTSNTTSTPWIALLYGIEKDA